MIIFFFIILALPWIIVQAIMNIQGSNVSITGTRVIKEDKTRRLSISKPLLAQS
jgi:hypothetical protein